MRRPPAPSLPHSSRMLCFWISAPRRLRSASRCAANCACDIGSGASPSSSSLPWILGSARTEAKSAAILFCTSDGVFAGAKMPYHAAEI